MSLFRRKPKKQYTVDTAKARDFARHLTGWTVTNYPSREHPDPGDLIFELCDALDAARKDLETHSPPSGAVRPVDQLTSAAGGPLSHG